MPKNCPHAVVDKAASPEDHEHSEASNFSVFKPYSTEIQYQFHRAASMHDAAICLHANPWPQKASQACLKKNDDMS